MTQQNPAQATTTEGLTVSPALDLVVEAAQVPPHYSVVDVRVMQICALAVGLGVAAALVAQVLVRLIAFVTNFAFYGRFSLTAVSPAGNELGLWVIVPPVVGALIVGFMARYGSKAIRGHGIPEAMEQVLTNQSRIPPRITFLKPLSAAVAIGTGGPFGAEGPIIATGSALGSLVGQLLRTTAGERKVLLAAGAAAGMGATFGSPVSAVLLAIELLLFEFRPRSLIPVALASATATGVHAAIEGLEPVFAMPDLGQPSGGALAAYIAIGAVMGIAAVIVTRVTYGIEDLFEHLPIHWMWWPAVGAVAVGVVGYFAPRTLGVGYENISDIISNHLALSTVAFLCAMKFISWSIALGSGTSGGTLAPMFTIGAGLGALLGAGAAWVAPALHIDLRVAALVGMAAIFAGASRAMLASVVFAFETTLQPMGLLPLLGACAASYLVAGLLSRTSIMTEKIARRGILAPEEYLPDPLNQVLVRNIAAKNVVTLQADDTLARVRQWLETEAAGTTHQGFPVLDDRGILVGVLTRRDLLDPAAVPESRLLDLIRRPVKFIYDDGTVRQAADHMVNHGIGRLPVVERAKPHRLIGIISRSDVLSVYRHGIHERTAEEPNLRVRDLWRRPAKPAKAESPTPPQGA